MFIYFLNCPLGDNVTVTADFNFRLERAIPNVISAERADKVFTYEGSLTTPGCYESVTWIVYATHPPVTEGQVSNYICIFNNY